MNKLVATVGFVALLGAGYAGTSWYFGNSFKQTEEERIANLNKQIKEQSEQMQMPMPLIDIKLVDIKNNVFSSQANYQLKIAMNDKPIEFESHIQHGPLVNFKPMRYLVTYKLKDTSATNMLFQLTKGESPLTIKTEVNFSNSEHINAQVPPIKFQQPGIDIEFSGLNIDSDTDTELSFLNGSSKVDKLVVDFIGNSAKLNNLSFDFDLKRKDNFFIGKRSFKVQELSWNSMISGRLSNVFIDSGEIENGKLINASLAYGVSNINIGNNDFGKLDGTIKLDKVDLSVLNEIQKNPSDENIEKNFINLLQSQPLLSKNIELKDSDGSINSSLTVQFKPVESLNAISKPEDVISSGSLNASLNKTTLVNTFSKVLQLRGTDAQTSQIMANQTIQEIANKANNLFIDKGNEYETNITYADNQLLVNGTPTTWEEISNIGKEQDEGLNLEENSQIDNPENTNSTIPQDLPIGDVVQ
ncbi:MAG: YdgA family protein [Neisseriaceae bacterium]|nr:YdgA family protein [Neisseriaceae bacterium]